MRSSIKNIVVTRLASASIGFVAAAKRRLLASRLASAVMGLIAAAKAFLAGIPPTVVEVELYVSSGVVELEASSSSRPNRIA